MDGLAVVLNAVFEETPLVGRAFFVGLELCVLAPLLAVAVRLRILRTYRLQSLLWLFVIVNALAGLAMQAPYGVSLWRSAPPAPSPVSVSPDKVFRPMLREGDRPEYPAGANRPPMQDIHTAIGPPPGLAPPAPAVQAVPPWWRTLSAADALCLVWLAGAALMAGYLALERWRLRLLLKRATAPGPALAAQYDAEAVALDTWWKPVLRVTGDLETPAIVGVFRPVILVPRWLETEGTAEQWSWTLRHELTHWRHGDTLGQALRLIAQAIFFFHPVVWWTGKRWEEAAELACDRSLLETETDAVGYAQELCALLGMIGKRQRPLMSTGLFASRSHIGRRIETLLADPLSRPARLGFMQRALAAVVLVTLLGVGLGSANANLTAAAPAVARTVPAAPKAERTAPPSGRVLQFPEDYSMGTLDFGGESVEARGAVSVPDGASVSFGVHDAGAADLSPLAAFGPDDIQSISLSGTPVQDEQIMYLQGLTGLGRLELRETLVTDEGMQYLSGLTQLQRLNLNGTAVGDEGMRYLSGMTQMESLILNRTQVGDEGLSYIRDMTALTELDMWMLDITDEGMQYLAGLKNMYELGIEDTLITDEGLRYLERMQHLYQLNLENNNITDAGLRSLVGLQSLARIGLSDTYLTEAGMALLAQMPALEAARLPVQIGPEGLKYLEGTAVGNFLASNVGDLRPVTVSITGGGRPLPNAHFSLAENPDGGEREIYFFRTGPTGDARIYLPKKPVPYLLRVYAEGYVTNEAAWAAPTPNILRLDLERASRIGGTVVDEGGSLVPGVAVSIPVLGGHNWDSEEALPHTVLTDGDGHWTCDVAPKKLADFWVSLDHRDYATTTYTMADLPVGALQAGTAVLTIADPIGLPGVVVDDAGAPVAGVRLTELEKWRQYGMRATGRNAVSDAEGGFEIRPIRPGDAVLKIEAVGYVPQSQTVNVTADMAPIRIVMKSSGVLRGRVVNGDATPLEGVQVWAGASASNGVSLGSWRGKTDGEGRFVWQEAPDGIMSIYFQDGEAYHEVSEVRAGEKEQEFVVPFREASEGLEEGKALIERFNQMHSVEHAGSVAFKFEVEEKFSPDVPAKVTHYEGVRMGDGRYRETVRFGKEGNDTLPWRHSWNGTTYVRHGHPAPGASGEPDASLYFVSGENQEPAHLIALDWLLLFVRDHSPTMRYAVLKYVDGVVTLGDGGKTAMTMRFSDPEKLEYDRIAYFNEEGRNVFTIEASGWSAYNDISYPNVVLGKYNYESMNGASTYHIEMILPAIIRTEDFTWTIPWESPVLIQDIGAEEAEPVDVLQLDAGLIRAKKYLEALAGLVGAAGRNSVTE